MTRKFRFSIALLGLGLGLAIWASPAGVSGADKLRVYVGTYTGEKSQGIYVLELDLASGALTKPQLAAEANNPSFLALDNEGRFLYAVSEVNEFKEAGTGAVSAFAIDQASGKLTLLNHQGSGGAGPCHLVVESGRKHVLVANYGGGSVALLPVAADGRLGQATSTIQHRGSSVNPRRQEGPHAHSIRLSADDRYAFSADLGLDQVLSYRIDGDRLVPNDPPYASVAPGAGPRHFAFHPDGRRAYVINELGNTITAFDYNSSKGTLQEVQTISTLPADFSGTSYTAEVVVHPSGRFVYGSNRGHDSIAIFSVIADPGRLEAIGHEPTQGKTPRNFNVDPSGQYLIAANQDSDSLVVFRIDSSTGKLTPTGHKAEVGRPVCVKFVRM